MTDLNKEREVNLRFEQDNGAVWVFAGDSQFGTEISHLMMMHADEYNEDELRVICHHAACEIDRLRAELAKAKAQAVPVDWVIVPQELPLDMALKIAKERILEQPPVKDPVLNEILEKAHKENIQSEQCRLMRDYKEMVKRLSESGAEG
ncbi:TPA: hypothetical protein ACSIYC_001221 [Acinetobacter baumannii]|uniref:hypothetical protein n=1 Tax=Acinetobacter baumannii TaxID=470 RepID=UPI000F26CB34|nr:hypothetical protein [Acinetobacter baumannii]EJD6467158.1 hypothetical protein [Acinetobacter baumannii]MBW4059739.1 hypothetical protein [Acinetobacter baumannii]MBW4063158.1 hypothetical protein [Acinetobacter baumannii]MBW4066665.1 hypothetical protein [Acinetobacter baumannii]MBW4072066.1 hypothetical protein [Acinetobacter baumannii]